MCCYRGNAETSLLRMGGAELSEPAKALRLGPLVLDRAGNKLACDVVEPFDKLEWNRLKSGLTAVRRKGQA
jgi:hypothetical protein